MITNAEQIRKDMEDYSGYCPVCKDFKLSLPRPALGVCLDCSNHLKSDKVQYNLEENHKK